MKKYKRTFGPVIGMCGRSGSGKTTVCVALEKYGVRSVDTDKVYRSLITPTEDGEVTALLRRIGDRFGDDVILSDGSLNRRALSSKVFGEGNEENLRDLNRITHTAILDETETVLESYFRDGAVGVIVDAPALFESGFHERCDGTVCVTAPDDVAVMRIMARDGITEAEAVRRLSSQISAEELSHMCDLTVTNGDEYDPCEAARMIFERFIED